MTKDSITTYFISTASVGGGMAASDHSVWDWLTFEVVRAASSWSLYELVAILAVASGSAAAIWRIVLDTQQAMRNKKKFRLEVELLKLQIDQNTSDENKARD